MASIGMVTNFLEGIAPLSLQEEYDNAGLITGSPDWEVEGVLCSLDCTPEVVEEAIDCQCNLIVSHHPIVFRGLKKLTGDSYVVRTLVQAIQNNIAIYSIHTNLDSVLKNGVNERIARVVGLDNYSILDPRDDDGVVGFGVVGELERPMNISSFLHHIKNQFGLEVIRYTPVGDIKKVQRIAVCGGSGSFLLPKAIEAGADVLITSDFKYHQFFDAENRIVIMDIGHYESEKFTIQLLHELISNNFTNFAAQMTKVNTNPVRYFI